MPSLRAGRGGQTVSSDAAIQACLTIKVLFGLPLRQTTGFVASLLKLAGLDWPVPDHSTLCRRQRTLKVMLPYRGSPGPLNLLVDSTGIKVRGEGEWVSLRRGFLLPTSPGCFLPGGEACDGGRRDARSPAT